MKAMEALSFSPNSNLSMLNFLHILDDVLGCFDSTLGVRGKRLSSYGTKRDFYSDKMRQQLLLAFLGERCLERLENDYPYELENTEKIFTHLFEVFEELIFFVQREYDSSLYEEIEFLGWHFVFLFMVITSQQMSERANLYLKTCPVIYLNRCVTDVFENGGRVSKAIRSSVGQLLDELKGEHQKSVIGMYTYLNKIDDKKNISASFSSVCEQVDDLRTELKDLYWKKELDSYQVSLIDELQGVYSCFLVLARLQRVYEQSSQRGENQFFTLLGHYLEVSEEIYAAKKLPKEEIKAYKGDARSAVDLREIIIPFYDGFHNYIWTANPWDRASRCLEGYSDLYNGLFLSLENVSFVEVESLIDQLRSYSPATPEIDRVISCLICMQHNDRKQAFGIVCGLTDKLSVLPYSLRNFVCLLYVALSLSSSFRVSPRSLDRYVSMFLETSLTRTVYHAAMWDDGGELVGGDFESLEAEKGYVFNAGLVDMIGKYNRFIIKNNFDFDLFLVNPISKINEFLIAFYDRYEKYKSQHTDEECVRLALTGLQSKFKRAKASFIDFDFKDLRSDSLIHRLGLLEVVDTYSGCQAIGRFIQLPMSRREFIFEECENVFSR